MTIEYRIKVHAFGSYVNGKPNPRDLDIAIEFLEHIEPAQRVILFYKSAECWEMYLSEKIGMKVDLQILEPTSVNIQKYLKEASLLLYASPESEDKI